MTTYWSSGDLGFCENCLQERDSHVQVSSVALRCPSHAQRAEHYLREGDDERALVSAILAVVDAIENDPRRA